MNTAQVLGIAAATLFYVLTMDEPWSVRMAQAHANVCEAAAEVESVGVEILVEPERFFGLLPTQRTANSTPAL